VHLIINFLKIFFMIDISKELKHEMLINFFMCKLGSGCEKLKNVIIFISIILYYF